MKSYIRTEDLDIQIGTPVALYIDYSTGFSQINLTSSSNVICDLWTSRLSGLTDVAVCLSGGLDSQFILALAVQSNVTVTAVTFDFQWYGNTINADDIITATAVAKLHNVPHEIKTVDLSAFLDSSKLTHYAHLARTASPQIAAHIYAMDTVIPPAQVVLVGGEVPYIGLGASGKATINDEKITSRYYKSIIAPYYRWANQRNRKIIRDPFLQSPEILYLAYKQNVAVIKNTRSILNLVNTGPMVNYMDYKYKYYNSFGLPLIQPILKRTGFETLKYHLATLTGRYDEFDIRYRRPLESLADRENWFSTNNKFSTVVKYNGSVDDILCSVDQLANSTDLAICNRYSFDW